jgi:hypothetical protein
LILQVVSRAIAFGVKGDRLQRYEPIIDDQNDIGPLAADLKAFVC